MKKIFVVIMLALLSKNAWAQEVRTIGVRGMVCSFCAQGITKKFKEQPEVSAVEVSLENKFVKLTYKEGQNLSDKKIADLLKEAGYEVVKHTP